MLYKSNIPVTIEINTVQDLSKLGAFMEHNDIKVNKSEIARKLNINRRTVDKYLKGLFLSSKIVTLLSKIFLENSAFIPRSA